MNLSKLFLISSFLFSSLGFGAQVDPLELARKEAFYLYGMQVYAFERLKLGAPKTEAPAELIEVGKLLFPVPDPRLTVQGVATGMKSLLPSMSGKTTIDGAWSSAFKKEAGIKTKIDELNLSVGNLTQDTLEAVFKLFKSYSSVLMQHANLLASYDRRVASIELLLQQAAEVSTPPVQFETPPAFPELPDQRDDASNPPLPQTPPPSSTPVSEEKLLQQVSGLPDQPQPVSIETPITNGGNESREGEVVASNVGSTIPVVQQPGGLNGSGRPQPPGPPTTTPPSSRPPSPRSSPLITPVSPQRTSPPQRQRRGSASHQFGGFVLSEHDGTFGYNGASSSTDLSSEEYCQRQVLVLADYAMAMIEGMRGNRDGGEDSIGPLIAVGLSNTAKKLTSEAAVRFVGPYIQEWWLSDSAGYGEVLQLVTSVFESDNSVVAQAAMRQVLECDEVREQLRSYHSFYAQPERRDVTSRNDGSRLGGLGDALEQFGDVGGDGQTGLSTTQPTSSSPYPYRRAFLRAAAAVAAGVGVGALVWVYSNNQDQFEGPLDNNEIMPTPVEEFELGEAESNLLLRTTEARVEKFFSSVDKNLLDVVTRLREAKASGASNDVIEGLENELAVFKPSKRLLARIEKYESLRKKVAAIKVKRLHRQLNR